jgi:hypothetical protein
MRHPLTFSTRGWRSRQGIALISVLIMVALITVVVVGFIVTSGLEMTSSRFYSASSGARLMADTTVNLVQAQINQATSQGPTYAWASQPGAIRVWDNTGSLNNIYKLYSAQTLTTNQVSKMNTASTGAGTNDMPPASWPSYTALWTDLNAPVTDSENNEHFPIFDWRNATNVDGCTYNSNIPGNTATQAVPMPVVWLYVLQNGQIIEPDAAATGGSSGTGTLATFQNTASGVAPSSTNPIVGRIAFWTDDETCKVNINTAGGDGYFTENGYAAGDPTPIANANFWDTPHYNTQDEHSYTGLAGSQPAAGEFQRYPGHPGAVALNNILHGLGWTLPSYTAAQSPANTSLFYAYNTGTATPVIGITPRYAWGGSQDGTQETVNLGTFATSSIPFVLNPQNRLYSSVGEMLFQPNRTASNINGQNLVSGDNTRQQIETARFFLTAHSQAPEVNLFGEPRVSVWPVWAMTTPPITLSMSYNSAYWSGPAAWTPIDKLMCFASTVNGNGPSATQYPYYFVRGEPTSSTRDIGYTRNQQLLGYLDYLTKTAIPGYGGNFNNSAKYGQAGTRQILAEIFDYIRTINSSDTSMPLVGGGVNSYEYVKAWGVGFGGNFSENNASGWAQIAPNVINSTNAPTLYGSPYGWTGAYQGFAAFPRLNEIAIQFVALGQGILSANSSAGPQFVSNAYRSYVSGTTPIAPFAYGDTGPDPNGSQTPKNYVVKLTTPPQYKNNLQPPGNTVAIQAFILMDFTNPSQMFRNDGIANGGGIGAFLWAEVAGLDGLSIKSNVAGESSHPLGFTHDDAVLYQGSMSGNGAYDNNWDCINFSTGNLGRTLGFINAGSYGGKGILTGEAASDCAATNPFYSNIIPIAIPATSTDGTGTMLLTGATLTVTLYDGQANGPNVAGNTNSGKAAQPVQTYTINFGGGGSASSAMPLPITAAPIVPATPTNTTLAGYGPQVGIENNAPGGTSTPPQWTSYGYDRWSQSIIAVGDTVQSMVLSPQWSDARTLACSSVPAGAFQEHPLWGTTAWAYELFTGEKPWLTTTSGLLNPNMTGFPPYMPYVPPELTSAGILGDFPNPAAMDWDTGIGCLPDGPWINKADEGNTVTQNGTLPYYQDTGTALESNPSLFTPSHEVPSPGMFGSLSTGVDSTGLGTPTPWRTLLFRPSPPGTPAHLGGVSPEDHTILDLFWMPVEEPYAISEPFTSAGKININYQIQPFTYITRSTGIRAVLNSEKIAAVNAKYGASYKTYNGPLMSPQTNARFAVNVPLTLTQFDDKFNGTNLTTLNPISGTPDIFHSASQICDMYLVPLNPPEGDYGTAAAGISSFASKWYDGKTYGLVGDNVRERPYTNIYGQITTKSNTYTVYYTVQSLKNAEPQVTSTGTTPGQQIWDETKGSVVGEYRGSTTIERYIDPNQTLPDFAASPGTYTVDGPNPSGYPPTYYNWRIVDNHQFAP